MHRAIARSYVAVPTQGVCIRDRIRDVTPEDDAVLRAVGAHLGRLAAADLARRVRDGLGHSGEAWADRKRDLTALSSSRWAGSITKATNHQWGLARRAQNAHANALAAGIRTLRHRLSLPVGEPGRRDRPGGYRSTKEWHAKSRRLAHLEVRLAAVENGRAIGHVSVVRGGRGLANKRHNLAAAGMTQSQWRQVWESARWFLSADGESGKRGGNETIRVTPEGQISLRLPTPMRHLANAAHGRYVLAGRVEFAHRGAEWRVRVAADRAVAYRIHYNPGKDRWYVDASWRPKDVPAMSLAALRRGEVIGVDLNADHLAAWRVDPHGNPIGRPRTFAYDLSGSSTRRDAQVRHALTALLRWAVRTGAKALAVEDLNFTDSESREHYGRRKWFRRLVCGLPTGRFRARLLAMASEAGIAVIAVDPAYTSRWGAEHWQKSTSTPNHQTTRHEAAAVAIGRRALGRRLRRRAAPPRQHQTDAAGHRTVQAGGGSQGREEASRPGSGSRTRSVPPTRRPYAGDQATQHRSGPPIDQGLTLPDVQERFDPLFAHPG